MSLWVKFIASAVVVVFCGFRLCVYADRIAQITKVGRTFIGLIVLAVITSLPEVSVTISAVKMGALDLALGDLFGSNLFNLTIIAIVLLIFIRKPKLLSFSSSHFISLGFSLLLLSLAAIGIIFSSISGATALILIFYLFGAYIVFRSERQKVQNMPEGEVALKEGTFMIWVKFLVYSGILIVAAIYISGLGDQLSRISVGGVALGGTFIGSLLMAIATSLPEMAVAISAVRLGFFDMALGNIFGSNMFNMLIICFADATLGKESILSSVSQQHLFTIAFIVISSALVCAGLAYRTNRKVSGLAWDSVAVIFVYFTANLINFYLR